MNSLPSWRVITISGRASYKKVGGQGSRDTKVALTTAFDHALFSCLKLNYFGWFNAPSFLSLSDQCHCYSCTSKSSSGLKKQLPRFSHRILTNPEGNWKKWSCIFCLEGLVPNSTPLAPPLISNTQKPFHNMCDPLRCGARCNLPHLSALWGPLNAVIVIV